ncbi:MAG: hypothetical protein AAFY50_25210 [Cyanobacteria bacterium J06648_1]
MRSWGSLAFALGRGRRVLLWLPAGSRPPVWAGVSWSVSGVPGGARSKASPVVRESKIRQSSYDDLRRKPLRRRSARMRCVAGRSCSSCGVSFLVLVGLLASFLVLGLLVRRAGTTRS